MTVQELRDLLGAKPFQPFHVVMSSGHTYKISHRELAFLTQTSLVVGVDVSDDGIPEELKIRRLPDIFAIERMG